MNDATAPRASERALSVIVDNGAHALGNLGDVAMLQVAVARLRGLFPAISIRVLTDEPERLMRFCPSATPLPAEGLRALTRLGYLPGRFRLPARFSSRLAAIETGIRRSRPEILDALASRRSRRESESREGVEKIVTALEEARMVVLSGGGYLCDAFRNRAVSALGLLRRAQRRGRPTALLGQGIGPIADGPLRQTASSVLPRAMLITVRENRAGIPLLRSLGVSGQRTAVTGDDAIEPAFQARRTGPGAALGVNLRVTAYSALDGALAAEIGETLRGLARSLGAPLMPIPISLSPDSDLAAILQALRQDDGPTDRSRDAEDPARVIDEVGRCRLVITASYHAAVFALSQGIPAIGLARSRYYADKFLGLAEMFGAGCEVTLLEDDGWPARLEATTRNLWAASERLRPALLEAAHRQVEMGRQAYGRLRELV